MTAIREYKMHGTDHWLILPAGAKEYPEVADYRDYVPLAPPPMNLDPDRKLAVDVGKARIAAMRTKDQQSALAESMLLPDRWKPKPWWTRLWRRIVR